MPLHQVSQGRRRCLPVFCQRAADSFRHTGEVRIFDGRSFCPLCGSRLFEPPEETVEIMLGSLDEAPSDLTPTSEGWTIRREYRQKPAQGAEQSERDPKPMEANR